MGLDVVELIMDVEDEFQIKLNDDDYIKCRTVGDMAGLIQQKLRIPPSVACTSPHVFCELRRMLMEMFDTPRSQVRLDTRLEDLIPRNARRSDWRELQRRLGWRLPDLVVFRDTTFSISSLGDMAFIVALMLSVICLAVPWLAAPVVLLVAFAILSKCEFIFAPIATAVPAPCSTVRETVRTIQAWNLIRQPGEPDLAISERILFKLRQIVSDTLNIPVHDIHCESRFIEDLRCG